MRKPGLQALSIVLTVLLINIFIIPSRAYANIWNLPNGLLDLFDSDAQYSSYTVGARDAQTKAGQPSELAVFLMTTQEHYELFVCRETVDHVWRIDCQSTAAVLQPTAEADIQPDMEVIDENAFRLYYRYGEESEAYTFTFFNHQWLLASANIEGANSMLSCARSDNKLQFYISSQLICTSSDILLSDFNISLFPKNIQQLQAWQETYTKIPFVLPQPVRIVQTINKKLPVYSGPTEKSFRAARKKAVLSLREPFSVYGTHDGWTMVEYQISPKKSRIGWVKTLPTDTSATELLWEPITAVTITSTVLTDDPHVSQAAIETLLPDSQVAILYCLEPWWAYAHVTMNGTQYYGFIPLADLSVMN